MVVKKCLEPGKKKLEETESLKTRDTFKTLSGKEKKLTDSKKTTADLRTKTETRIEANFCQFDSNFESKMKDILERQESLLTELKTGYPRSNDIKRQILKKHYERHPFKRGKGTIRPRVTGEQHNNSQSRRM